jgi:hypothetical protein
VNYIPEIDEESGYCPHCLSSDTLSIRAKAKRVCLNCEFSEEFESYAQSVLAWQKKGGRDSGQAVAPKIEEAAKPNETPRISGKSKEVEKFIETIEPGITKVTIPTRYRDDFGRYLTSRKIELSRPFQTEIWNNVESAYTNFELLVKRPIAESIFDDWIAD